MGKRNLFIYLAIISLISAVFFQAVAAEKKDNDSPISILSDRLDLNEAKNIITFEGSVHADSGDSIIKCDRMEVFYIKDSSASTGNSKEDEVVVDRILCIGNVHITRTDGTNARADKAEMFQIKEILVLSGNATAWQDKNSVEGDVITLFLKEKRTVVESSGSSRVKAVIFRNGEKE